MKFIPGIQLSLSLSPLRLNLNILGFKAINEWKRSHVLTCVALLRGICTCLNYLSDYPPCDCTNFMEAHQTYLRSRTALSLMALWQPMSLELSPVATGNGCMDHGMVLDGFGWLVHPQPKVVQDPHLFSQPDTTVLHFAVHALITCPAYGKHAVLQKACPNLSRSLFHGYPQLPHLVVTGGPHQYLLTSSEKKRGTAIAALWCSPTSHNRQRS